VEHQVLLSSFAARFTTDAVRRAYQMFDGDLVMSLVFGEIAHYNVSRVLRNFSSVSERRPEQWIELLRGMGQEQILPSNALSISEATGIPRETVRRKVRALEQKRWLIREGGNALTLAPEAVQQFQEMSLTLLHDFLATARVIQELEAALANKRS